MFWINKITSILLSPLAISVVLLICSLLFSLRGKKRISIGLLFGAIIWLWGWSTGCTLRHMTVAIGKDYPPMRVEDVPKADAIVVLGGGIGSDLKHFPYPDLSFSADRAWHAARLWKTGRAPIVVITGVGEKDSSYPFLVDLGVPGDAILVENESRNTEENARHTEKLLLAEMDRKEDKTTILLVTSVWHMRRSLLIFQKYAPNLEVIPVATDYEMQLGRDRSRVALCPMASYFLYNTCLFKEMVGYFGYCVRGWFK